MRTPVRCVSVHLAVLLSCMVVAVASEPSIASGNIDDIIHTLSARTDAASLNLLARAYYSIEQFDNAISAGEKAANQESGNATYHLWLGREYGEKAAVANPLSAASLARKTKNEFEQAVKLDAANVQAHADLAEYYTEAPSIMGGGLDKARDQAAQVAKYDEATSHWILALVANKEKNPPETEKQLQQAIKVAKDSSPYWINLASYYSHHSRPDEMQKAISQALAQPNKSAEAYYNAASLLFQSGKDFAAAIQYLKKYLSSGAMVEDAPAFRAHYLLGQIYEKTGDKPNATAEYKAALALASGFAPASKALARVQ